MAGAIRICRSRAAGLSPPDPRREDVLERVLRAWGPGARLGERLGGGNRNAVRLVTLGGRRHALRRGARSGAALAWELELLAWLAARDIRVPGVVPAADGRTSVEGTVLFEWLDGDPPVSRRDWRLVAETLERVHRLTTGYRQRPGFRSLVELIDADASGDARLDLMPPTVVRRCRENWRLLSPEPLSVVHGDPGCSNIRITRRGVGLLDWDEARVDASILDIAALPLDYPTARDPARRAAARRALDGWEVANAWLVEPSYARRRLSLMS